jgi:hypothetical protein
VLIVSEVGLKRTVNLGYSLELDFALPDINKLKPPMVYVKIVELRP